MLNLIDRALKSSLARMLTWPHRPESHLEFLAPAVGDKAIKATVKAVRQETARAVSLILQPKLRWAGYVPGQHVTLTVAINGRRHSRTFTVSGMEGGCPIVTIQAHAGGIVSTWANESVWAGDMVELSPAAGDFVLPAARSAPFLLIAGGSGITPVRALLDQLIGEGHSGPVDILYYVPSSPEAIFLNHLQAVAKTCPNVKLHLITTRENRANTLRGHFSDFHLGAIGADIGRARAYVCGPAALMAAVESYWQQQRVTERLTLERFLVAPHPVATDAKAPPVHFADSGSTTTAPGRALLETAEGAAPAMA